MKTSYLSKRMSQLATIEMSTTYVNEKELKIKSVKNGIVHPLSKCTKNNIENYGGVTDEKMNFIDLSSTERVSPPNFNQPYNKWYRGANPSIDSNAIIYHNYDVVFIGALHSHYGHFITEGLSRLWYLLNEDKMKLPIVYIADDGAKNFIELFPLFGISSQNIVKIEYPTRFNNVIVPEQSMRLQDRFHNDYKKTIHKIHSNSKEIKSGKIFLSKRKRWNGRAIGEIFFENIFKENGYNVIYPENLSIIDFIAVIKGCDEFISVTGSSAHSAIFLKNGTRCIYLNRSPHFHPIQTMVDQINNLNSLYVDINMNFLPHEWSSGPFLLWPTKNFVKYCNDYNINMRFINILKSYFMSLFSYIYFYFYRQFKFSIYRPIKTMLFNKFSNKKNIYQKIK